MSTERWLLLAAIALFGLSLPLPAIEGAAFPAQSGFDVLRQGAGAWRDGVLAWYANPAFGLALLLCRFDRFRTALGFALLALLLGVSSFAAGAMATSFGRSVPPFSFGIGFYVWLGAICLAVVAALAGIYKVYLRPGRRTAP